jgi:transposase
MTDIQKVNQGRGGVKVPEFLREPLEAAQARLETFEEEAQRLLKEISASLERLRTEEWPEIKDRLERFREVGLERAQEWRGRAEHFRADALERLVELQGKAMRFLGVATRDEIEELSREIDRIMKRLDQGRRKGRKAVRRRAAQA